MMSACTHDELIYSLDTSITCAPAAAATVHTVIHRPHKV